MSDGQRGNFPERRKTALDHNKLGIQVPCPTAEGKKSKLSWGFHKNNPRLTVYTGDPADESSRTNNGRIQAEIDSPHLFMLSEMIRDAVKGEANERNCIECVNYIFPGGQRSEKPVTNAKLWVGKDKDGVVYLSLIDPLHKDRPIVKFDLHPGAGGDWIRVLHSDGTPYTRAEASSVFARGYANMLDGIYPPLAVANYEPYVPKQQGGGGFQRGGYGGGGGGQRGSSGGSGGGGGGLGDDDLPF